MVEASSTPVNMNTKTCPSHFKKGKGEEGE
jgi:hypothetical protein